jgi:two-component system, OmpR family, sensor histidine kinase BaeS
VDDLHALAIAELDGMHCSFDWGEVGPWLQRAVQRFEPLAAQAGVAMQIELSPDAQAVQAYWDFDRIGQVICVLLDNSLRYTQAPGRLSVQCTADVLARRCRLDVSDSAPAVPAADLDTLFEPWMRAARAPQCRAGQGSGLGLAIARCIVIAHGGSIVASLSALGGLTVRVDLPWEAQ